MRALPCIVCGRTLESLSKPNQPDSGLAFSSHGHYGTTVFDPMDGSALEINVCDPCLTDAKQRWRVMIYPVGSAARLWGADKGQRGLRAPRRRLATPGTPLIRTNAHDRTS